MYYLVGLGNPGKKYENTRHNSGKMVIDKINHMVDFVNIGMGVGGKEGWKSMATIIRLRGFMNESGEEIRQWLVGCGLWAVGKKEKGEKKGRDAPSGRRYGRRLIIIHDDIDLPLGKIRIQWNGGSGGHKGVQSIIDNLGTKEFWRVRLGIGRPSLASEADQYVLAEFAKDEHELAEKMINRAALAVMALVNKGPEEAMNEYNKQSAI